MKPGINAYRTYTVGRMAGVLWGIGKCIAIGGQKVIKHGSEQNLLGKMYPLVVYS